MTDERRKVFILFFGYLFPVSDAMEVKCWRAVRNVLTDDELDGLIVGLREATISKAHALKAAPVTSQDVGGGK